MAGQDSPEGEVIYDRRFHSPMKREYYIQMGMAMVIANYCNSSLGRSPRTSAKAAYNMMSAAWDVWVEEGDKEKNR